jgi:hypothetical protein
MAGVDGGGTTIGACERGCGSTTRRGGGAANGTLGAGGALAATAGRAAGTTATAAAAGTACLAPGGAGAVTTTPGRGGVRSACSAAALRSRIAFIASPGFEMFDRLKAGLAST